MISVRVPRVDKETTTTFTVMISHQGEDYVHTRVFDLPLTPEGDIDSREVDRIHQAEFEYVHNNRDTIWPARTPCPFERPLSETVRPMTEEELAAMPQAMSQQAPPRIPEYDPENPPFSPFVLPPPYQSASQG
jgi:hypothetical protein